MISSISSGSAWSFQSVKALSNTQRHKEMFTKLDTDGDGKVSKAELKAGGPADKKNVDIDSVFTNTDTDNDGYISETENDTLLTKLDSQMKTDGVEGKRPPPPPPGGGKAASASETTDTIFSKLDTNEDGEVSMEELLAASTGDDESSAITDLLKSADSNSDNTITKDELTSYLTRMEKQLKAAYGRTDSAEA